MKKYFILFQVILLALFISSCDEDSTGPEDGQNTGSIFIQSVPAGAQIWVGTTTSNLTNTNKTTPDSVLNLEEGNHLVRLVLAGYYDTTFTVNVLANLQTTRNINMVASASRFGPVRIWETTGTTAQQPSGLDLSTGEAISVSDNDHDIFYSSNGFVIVTSSGRSTVFYVGTGTDLDDGTDSPLAQNAGQGNWTDRVQDDENNYFFLYDQDLRYSKMIITSRGGGTPGNPAWVEVEWIYNLTTNNQSF